MDPGIFLCFTSPLTAKRKRRAMGRPHPEPRHFVDTAGQCSLWLLSDHEMKAAKNAGPSRRYLPPSLGQEGGPIDRVSDQIERERNDLR